MSSTTTSAAPPTAASTSAAGAPLTMADWAARQRALKEQDRKNKTASTEALRNYRGVGTLRDEDTLLTTLKEQDRKKKEETAEQMRHYRGAGALRDEDTKLAMMKQQDRQHKQDAERILHEYREKESDVANKKPENSKKVIQADAVYGGGKWNPEDEIAPGSVSNIRESFSNVSNNEPPTPTSAPTARVRDAIVPTVEPVVERSVGKLPISNANSATTSSAAVSAYTTTAQIKQQLQQQQHQTSVSNGYSAPTTTTPATVTPTPPHSFNTTGSASSAPSLKRLDVKFSFGIVSLADTPLLDGYMVAVKDIVDQGLLAAADGENINLGTHVSCNAEYPPFVNEVEKDDSYKDPTGRSNVKRFLVKASVPIFVKSGFTSQSARRGVIGILQQAIQSGVLLSNAAATTTTTKP